MRIFKTTIPKTSQLLKSSAASVNSSWQGRQQSNLSETKLALAEQYLVFGNQLVILKYPALDALRPNARESSTKAPINPCHAP